MAAAYRERQPPNRDADALGKTRAVLGDGGVLADALDVPDTDHEAMYAVAYDVYAKGQYERAQKLFAQLALYDHQDPRYMKGLAATTQMLGDYEQAVQMYAVVVAMDASDPVPVMHAGDCFKAMGKHAEAAESFNLARAMCDKPAHDQVKRRCEQLLGNMKPRAV